MTSFALNLGVDTKVAQEAGGVYPLQLGAAVLDANGTEVSLATLFKLCQGDTLEIRVADITPTDPSRAAVSGFAIVTVDHVKLTFRDPDTGNLSSTTPFAEVSSQNPLVIDFTERSPVQCGCDSFATPGVAQLEVWKGSPYTLSVTATMGFLFTAEVQVTDEQGSVYSYTTDPEMVVTIGG